MKEPEKKARASLPTDYRKRTLPAFLGWNRRQAEAKPAPESDPHLVAEQKVHNLFRNQGFSPETVWKAVQAYRGTVKNAPESAALHRVIDIAQRRQPDKIIFHVADLLHESDGATNTAYAELRRFGFREATIPASILYPAERVYQAERALMDDIAAGKVDPAVLDLLRRGEYGRQFVKDVDLSVRSLVEKGAPPEAFKAVAVAFYADNPFLGKRRVKALIAQVRRRIQVESSVQAEIGKKHEPAKTREPAKSDEPESYQLPPSLSLAKRKR